MLARYIILLYSIYIFVMYSTYKFVRCLKSQTFFFFQYLEVFNQSFQALSLNLAGFSLLPRGGKEALLKFKSSTLNQIDYVAVLDVVCIF